MYSKHEFVPILCRSCAETLATRRATPQPLYLSANKQVELGKLSMLYLFNFQGHVRHGIFRIWQENMLIIYLEKGASQYMLRDILSPEICPHGEKIASFGAALNWN